MQESSQAFHELKLKNLSLEQFAALSDDDAAIFFDKTIEGVTFKSQVITFRNKYVEEKKSPTSKFKTAFLTVSKHTATVGRPYKVI